MEHINKYFELVTGLFHFPIYMKKKNVNKFNNFTEEFEYHIQKINNDNNKNFILKKNFIVNDDNEYGSYKCICGHPIKIIYVITDKRTGYHFGVGSDCITKDIEIISHLKPELKKLEKRKKVNDKSNIKRIYKKVLESINNRKSTPYFETAKDKSERLSEERKRKTRLHNEAINDIENKMSVLENRNVIVPFGKLKGEHCSRILTSHMYKWFIRNIPVNDYPFNKYVDLCRRLEILKMMKR